MNNRTQPGADADRATLARPAHGGDGLGTRRENTAPTPRQEDTMTTTILELTHEIAESLGLADQDTAVRAALVAHRSVWGRYEDITDAQRQQLSRLVWEDVIGDEYPFQD